MIFVSLFLCLVPIITDPSPHYFIALVLIALGVAVYIPFVFYRIRPRCIGKWSQIMSWNTLFNNIGIMCNNKQCRDLKSTEWSNRKDTKKCPEKTFWAYGSLCLSSESSWKTKPLLNLKYLFQTFYNFHLF